MSRKRKPTVDALFDQRYAGRNDPESRNLTEEENILFANARAALVTLRKTFETWIVIGKAVVAARARADRIGGGKTFRRILEQQGLGELPSATATRLEQIVARLDEVAGWHNGLPGSKQIAWASPSTVYKQCPVFAKDRAAQRPAMRPRRPGRANVEVAIDTIIDGCRELAMDERMVIAARIAEGLGLASPKTDRKRRAGKAATPSTVPAPEWPSE